MKSKSIKKQPKVTRRRMLQLQLLLERRSLIAGALESEPKEIAELREHLVRGFSIFVNQGGYGVERIEEKVRVNLHPNA